MFAKKALIAIATLAAAASASAANNPLQPDFYWNGSAAVGSGEVERYVTANNPLVPTYSNVERKVWTGTGAGANNTPFIDNRNPLYPHYKRS
jgi:hypothetical protein